MKHYKQTTGYTCDPACLMMAMHAIDSKIKMTKQLEISIWKEANLRSVDGCLPQGLALSAHKRNFHTSIICRKQDMLQTTKDDEISVRIAKKQQNECIKHGIKIIDKTPTIRDVEKSLETKGIPIVLVNTKMLHGIRSPHWIVIDRIAGNKIYFHDPLMEKTASLNKKDFGRMQGDVKEFLNKRMLIVSRKENK